MVTHTGPGTYRIKVLGRVNATWPAVANFSLTYEEHKDYGALTAITGEFPDQTALGQFLGNLAAQRFPVLAVERLNPDE
ncbi:MAG: hypothetical protein OES12_01660 [Anaerolineae bacterium]|nr:hypothetical protein [Anaerolineae bacterium]